MSVFQSVETKIPSQHVLLSQVTVHITDENDCSPEFQHSIYSRDNIPETIPVGTSLLQGEDHPGTFRCSLAMNLPVCIMFLCSHHEEGLSLVRCGWLPSWRAGGGCWVSWKQSCGCLQVRTTVLGHTALPKEGSRGSPGAVKAADRQWFTGLP